MVFSKTGAEDKSKENKSLENKHLEDKLLENILPDKYDGAYAEKVINRVKSSRLFNFCFKNVFVEGIDDLKKYFSKNQNTVAMSMSNHVSLFDYVLYRFITYVNGLRGNRAAGIIEGSNLSFPIISGFWEKMGGLKFERWNKSKEYLMKVMAKISSLLLSGKDLLVYPEGTRKQTKEYKINTPFLTPLVRNYLGGQKLALVPIYVGYDEPIEGKTLNLSHKLKWLGKIRHCLIDAPAFAYRFIFEGRRGNAYIFFGEPIPLEAVVKGDNDNVHLIKNELANIVSYEISKLEKRRGKY